MIKYTEILFVFILLMKPSILTEDDLNYPQSDKRCKLSMNSNSEQSSDRILAATKTGLSYKDFTINDYVDSNKIIIPQASSNISDAEKTMNIFHSSKNEQFCAYDQNYDNHHMFHPILSSNELKSHQSPSHFLHPNMFYENENYTTHIQSPDNLKTSVSNIYNAILFSNSSGNDNFSQNNFDEARLKNMITTDTHNISPIECFNSSTNDNTNKTEDIAHNSHGNFDAVQYKQQCYFLEPMQYFNKHNPPVTQPDMHLLQSIDYNDSVQDCYNNNHSNIIVPSSNRQNQANKSTLQSQIHTNLPPMIEIMEQNLKRKLNQINSSTNQSITPTVIQLSDNEPNKIYHIQKDTPISISSNSEIYFYHNILSAHLTFHVALNQICIKMQSDSYIVQISNTILREVIKHNLEIAEKNFASMNGRKNVCANSLNYRYMKLSSFCIFCRNDECLNSTIESSSSFNYSQNIENAILKHSDIILITEFFSLMNQTEKIYHNMKILNISFISNFINHQQNAFSKIIDRMLDYKICADYDAKLEIIEKLIHDFQCNHIDLKLILIPEFFSLIFQLKNKTLHTFYKRTSIVFISLYYYFRSMNCLFDFLSRVNCIHLWQFENSSTVEKLKLIILSTLVRLNYMESIIVIITKSDKILHRYRFVVYSLFQLENEKIHSQHFNKNDNLVLLHFILWLGCCNIDHAESPSQIDWYHSCKNSEFFILNNMKTFREFALIYTKFWQSNSKLQIQKNIKNLEYLRHILISSERWI